MRDLGSAAGREAYGLDDDELQGVAIVPLRVRNGDDASGIGPNNANDASCYSSYAGSADGEEIASLCSDGSTDEEEELLRPYFDACVEEVGDSIDISFLVLEKFCSAVCFNRIEK